MDKEKELEKNCSCSDENCDCCSHDDEDTVELEDENGNIVKCQIIDSFAYENTEYVLVQNSENQEVYLFKVKVNEDKNINELEVPNDEEFKSASEYYEKLMEEE